MKDDEISESSTFDFQSQYRLRPSVFGSLGLFRGFLSHIQLLRLPSLKQYIDVFRRLFEID